MPESFSIDDVLGKELFSIESVLGPEPKQLPEGYTRSNVSAAELEASKNLVPPVLQADTRTEPERQATYLKWRDSQEFADQVRQLEAKQRRDYGLEVDAALLDRERRTDTLEKTITALPINIETGLQNVAEQVGGVIAGRATLQEKLPYLPPSLLSIPAVQRLVKEQGDTVREVWGKLSAENRRDIEGLGQDAAGKALGRLVETAATSSAAIPAAVIGGLPAAAGVAGAQSFGGTFNEAQAAYEKAGDDKATAEGKALAPAIASGVATALITAAGGKTGIEAIAKLGSAQAVKALGAKNLKDIAGSVLKNFGAEAVEEGSDQIVQSIIQVASYNPELSFKDAVGQVMEAGAMGGILGGVVGGAVSTVEAYQNKKATKGEPNAVREQGAVEEVPAATPENVGLPKGEEGKPAVQEVARAREVQDKPTTQGVNFESDIRDINKLRGAGQRGAALASYFSGIDLPKTGPGSQVYFEKGFYQAADPSPAWDALHSELRIATQRPLLSEARTEVNPIAVNGPQQGVTYQPAIKAADGRVVTGVKGDGHVEIEGQHGLAISRGEAEGGPTQRGYLGSDGKFYNGILDVARNRMREMEQWADKELSIDPRTQSQMGLDPMAEARRLSAAAVKGAAIVGRGVSKFADWSGEMIKSVGEWVQPKLVSIWERITGKGWNAELKALSDTLYAHTPEDVATMKEAQNVIGQSPTARRIFNELSQTEEGKSLLNSMQFRVLRESVASLPEGHVNYLALRGNLDVHPSVKSNARRMALKQIEAFDDAYQVFKYGYETRKATLESEAKELGTRGTIAATKRDVAGAVMSYLRTRGRRELRDEQESARAAVKAAVGDAKRTVETQTLEAEATAALKAVDDTLGNSDATRNALEYIAHNLDFSLLDPSLPDAGRIKSGQELVNHLRGGTDWADFSQTVQAPREVIENVARVVRASEPLRQRLMEAKELAGGEQPFAELQAELRKALAGKDIRKAMDIMARGIGKTAADKALSARLAKLLLAKETRVLNQLRTLENTKQALDTIATSGDYQNIRRTVLSDTGVSEVLHTTEGTDYVLNPVTKGGQVYKISMAPDGSMARKGLEDYRKWQAEALEEIRELEDADSERFNPTRARNLRDALDSTSFIGNPANQPGAGIFVFHAIQKLTQPISRVIAYWDKVPRLTIGRLAGFPAELVGRQLTAWETAGKAQQMVNASHLKMIHQARKQALKVQGFGHTEAEIKRYVDLVYNPLVESYQSFDVTPLKAGDSLRNGYTVKGSDIAYYKADSEWQRSIQKQLEGKSEDAFSILQQQPLKVIYKTKGGEQRTRDRLETGPRTVSGNPRWAYGRATDWHKQSAESKEAWLDKHLQSIVQSYVRGVAENNFLNNSKVAPELEAVWKGMTDSPLEAFADLVTRVEEQLPLREGAQDINARTQILAEIGGLFDRVDKAGKVVEGKIEEATLNKSRVNVESWTSEFNTARGQRIMPAGWYKYGAPTSAEQASFLSRGLRPFEYAYLETLEAVLKSMTEMDQHYKENNTGSVKAWLEGRAKQKLGVDFYTPGQLRSVLKEVAHHVDEVKAAIQNQEKYAFTVDETGAAVQGASANYLMASLLSGSTWNLNLVGATAAETGFDRTVRGFYTAKAATMNLGMAHWSLLARDGLYRLGLANPAMQRFLRKTPVRVFTANVSKLMADSVARTKEAYGDTRRGGAIQRADMIDMLQYMYELRYSGGKPGPVSSSRVARTAQAGVALPARAVAGVATHLLAITDANRNVSLYQRAKEMAAEAETRALKFGEARMESGLNPFDANGRVDLTRSENRFSDKELLGREGVDAKLAFETPETARRYRDFFAKQAGLDIDQLMWDFVKRHGEAVAKEKAEGVKEGTYSDKVRMMTEPQVRQLGLGIAAYGNLSTVGNRPMRSHQIKNLLLPFLAYPAYWKGLIETYGQNLSTRTALQGRIGSLPMLIGIAAVLSIFGAVGMAESDLFKRFFMGKHTQAPTILNAQNQGEVARALLSGFGSVVPFYGSIVNNITGAGARNGFDVNSQFVALNVATDMMKTAREVYMTGDASYPAYRLAERYAFPANYLARLLPGYSGLKEQANERADMRVAARNAGLETLLRKPGGVPDLPDYGPATAILREWDNAVGNRDTAGAQAAYQKLVVMEAQTGSPNPEASALQKVRKRTPLNSVLHRQPTEPELAQLLAAMPANDRAKVQAGMQFMDSAVQGLGGNSVAFAKAERGTGSSSGGFAGFGGTRRGGGRSRRVGRRPGRVRKVRAGRTRRAPSFRRKR